MANYYVDYDGSISTDKKKKKKSTYYVDESGKVTRETVSDDDIAPVKSKKDGAKSLGDYLSRGISKLNEMGDNSSTKESPKTLTKATWVDKGAFEDGVDSVGDFFKSLGKTTVGTLQDVNENITTAVVDATENLIDTTAYGVGAVGGWFDKGFRDDVGNFIAK